jgi:hypothetical protein
MANLIYGSNTIGSVIECVRKYTSQKVTNIALDGTPYVQTTGDATHRRTVSVYCPTSADKDALDNASNNGALLSISGWNGQDIKGYIEKDVTWKEWKDGHAVGRFTMIVKEVVDE